MNIFIIPSWYPSNTNPAWGIFCREQAEALADTFPHCNLCVSLWGQNNDETLLVVKDHFKNIQKLISAQKFKTDLQILKENLVEYTSPAFTWTRKIARGNIRQIVKANEHNLHLFSQRFGKPDVIHAHIGYPAGYIAMCLGQKFGVPYIITEHMAPFPFESLKRKNGELINELYESYENASKIIAVSENMLHALVEKEFKNIIFIPNMVNEALFKPNALERENESFKFLFIGGLIERKGVDVLIKAVSKIHSGEHIRLTIGGDGVLEEKYQKYAQELNVNVVWLGFLNRNEVVTEMQKCDVFVLVSRKEGLPLVLLEALACGKPVIASRSGGPEIIVNADNGLLVEVEDDKALAEAMDYMMKNYTKFDPMMIRKDFEKRFSRSVIASKIMEVYKKAIAGYGRGNL